MPTITIWEPSFSVGSYTLDRQHQKLLRLCNLLGEICTDTSDRPRSVFHTILHELSEYSRDHFETEEAFLRDHGYPDLQQQQHDHLQYCRQIANATFAAATMGVVDQIAMQRFIANWWIDHILVSDMKFRDLLIARNAA